MAVGTGRPVDRLYKRDNRVFSRIWFPGQIGLVRSSRHFCIPWTTAHYQNVDHHRRPPVTTYCHLYLYGLLVRVLGWQYLSFLILFLTPTLSIPCLECLICLFAQHLKRLEDMRLLGTLRPNSTANANHPIQISPGKRNVVSRGQARVECQVECVELCGTNRLPR